MAAAVIEISLGVSGLSPTLDLYPIGSDTAAATGIALTEATNRKTVYTGTTSSGLTGEHEAFIKVGSTVIFWGFVWMTDDTAIHRVADAPYISDKTAQSVTSTGGGGGGGDQWATILNGTYTGQQAGAILLAIQAGMAVLVSQAGPGATACTLHFVDTNGASIANAQVWLTSDQGGSSIVAGVSLTNSTGNVVFLLTTGTTYYLWARKDGELDISAQPYVATA